MKPYIRIVFSAGVTLIALFSGSVSFAQQRVQSSGQPLQTPQVYDAKRETTLLGTIVEYAAASNVVPFGAHATVQTASGLVDVQLGNSRFLEANHFSLAAGDSVRIIGENVTNAQSALFLARIVQKGVQSLAVRSVRGIPLTYAPPRPGASSAGKPQGGVL
jgi:hypothetical protein